MVGPDCFGDVEFASQPQYGDGRVDERRKNTCGGADKDPVAGFPVLHVHDVVERLNDPEASDDLVDPFRGALVGVEAGDQVDDLDGWLPALGPHGGVGEVADLLGHWPG